MSEEYFETARKLAKAHKENDPDLKSVYLAKDPKEIEVRLIEVTASVATTGEVLPCSYRPDPKEGIPLPSVVILLSPAEWEQYDSGKMKLPEGWERENLRELNT